MRATARDCGAGPEQKRGNTMRSSARSLASVSVLALVAAAGAADAATITGTVTGPDGAPFRAAFVQARHEGQKMTVSVLTDNQGRYVVENLPAGDYTLGIRAIGYDADSKADVKL